MIRRGRIVVLAIAALVGGVVIVQAVLGESDSGRERASERLALTGPDAPTARALPGSLYVTREGCEAGHIDFATVALHVSPSRGCDPAAPHGSVRASGVSSGTTISINRSVELAGVSPATLAVAGESRLPKPVAVPRRSQLDESGPGRTTSQQSLPIVAGALRLEATDIARGLGKDRLHGVVGYDVTRTGHVGVLVAAQSATRLLQVLQIWSDTGLERTVEVSSVRLASVSLAGDFGLSGRLIRLSPTGRELAIISEPGVSRVTLVDVASGTREVLRPLVDLDWSPDGHWLAVSDGEEILVYGALRTDHVFALGVAADAIEWRD